MKKLSIVLISIFLLVLAGPTLADKPDPKLIRHCGCVYDSIEGVDMIFHDVVVAGNSQGHRNHLAGTQDACFAGMDGDVATYELWERDLRDCMLSGTNQNLPFTCAGDDVPDFRQDEFDNCGTKVPEPE
jgi:hypothetical protein